MSKPPSPLEKYYLQLLEDRGVSPPSFELNDFLFENLKVEVDNDGNASFRATGGARQGSERLWRESIPRFAWNPDQVKLASAPALGTK